MVLKGDAGNDRLIGTPFNDELHGGTGSDTFPERGLDLFFDGPGYNDKVVLIEINDLDVMITDTRFITGKILGDGLIQVVTTVDGLDEVESQLIESNLKSGHFTLKYNNTTRVNIAYNAEAEDVEGALRGIILNSTLEFPGRVLEMPIVLIFGRYIFRSDGSPMPGLYMISSDNDNVSVVRSPESDLTRVEKQGTHSGADGTFRLGFGDGVNAVVTTGAISYKATANQMETALEALDGVGNVKVETHPTNRTEDGSEPYTWNITFEKSEKVRGYNVNQLLVIENNLTSGGAVSSLPLESELEATVRENNPNVGIPDNLNRFKAGATVENLKGIFEIAYITGSVPETLWSSADRVVQL